MRAKITLPARSLRSIDHINAGRTFRLYVNAVVVLLIPQIKFQNNDDYVAQAMVLEYRMYCLTIYHAISKFSRVDSIRIY